MAVLALLTLAFSAAPALAIDSSDLPALADGPLPKNLKPTLTMAKNDRSKAYIDHCHVQQNLTASPAPCNYGDTSSSTTIVLFGDSHALSWFPAIEKLALAKHWKLISLTMSSCWPAYIPAFNTTTNKMMNNCAIWRDSALAQIQSIKPSLLFVAGTRGFATTNDFGDVASGDEKYQIWKAGIARTLKALVAASARVIYIGDIPISMYDVPVCLASNKGNYSNCATPYWMATDADWTIKERQAATSAGAEFVDPTFWICKTDPCSPIEGNRLIYLDAGHITATYSVTLEKPLWAAISGKK